MPLDNEDDLLAKARALLEEALVPKPKREPTLAEMVEDALVPTNHYLLVVGGGSGETRHACQYDRAPAFIRYEQGWQYTDAITAEDFRRRRCPECQAYCNRAIREARRR